MLYMLHSMYTSMVYVYPIIHASRAHTYYVFVTYHSPICMLLIIIAYTCKCSWDVVLWYIGIYHTL